MAERAQANVIAAFEAVEQVKALVSDGPTEPLGHWVTAYADAVKRAGERVPTRQVQSRRISQ